MPSPGTGRLAHRHELHDGDWPLVQRLAGARLVITGRGPGGAETVELAHEALIQHWGRLRRWMEADRAFYTWYQHLRAALRQWLSNDRDEGTLLRSAPLAEAEAWLAEREEELSPVAREFIQTSVRVDWERQHAEEERRQRELAQAQALAEAERRRTMTEAKTGRRLRGLAAGLAILFLLAVGGALLALSEQRRAQRAADLSQSLNLSTSAQLALAEHDTDLALALAVEANRISDPPLQAQMDVGRRRLRARHPPHLCRTRGAGGSRGPRRRWTKGPFRLGRRQHSFCGIWTRDDDPPLRGHSDTIHAVALLPGGRPGPVRLGRRHADPVGPGQAASTCVAFPGTAARCGTWPSAPTGARPCRARPMGP